MLLLSLATFPGAVVQLLTKLNQQQSLVIDALDWLVVSIFVVEYIIMLNSAGSKGAYVADPWHALDLAVILLAIGGFITSLPILYSAPALRIFKAGKILAESGRPSGRRS